MNSYPKPGTLSNKELIDVCPKVKYSELTTNEKINTVRNACMDILEDMIGGNLTYQMNDEWYSTVLKLIEDLGYDISRIKTVDWNHLKKIEPYIGSILCDTEDAYYSIPTSQRGRSIFVQQILINE